MKPNIDFFFKQTTWYNDRYSGLHTGHPTARKHCVSIGNNASWAGACPWRHRALEPGAFLCLFSCLLTRLLSCLGVFLWSLKSKPSCGPCGSCLTSPLFSGHRTSLKRPRMSAQRKRDTVQWELHCFEAILLWDLAISRAKELPPSYQLHRAVRYFPPTPSLAHKSMSPQRTSFKYT